MIQDTDILKKVECFFAIPEGMKLFIKKKKQPLDEVPVEIPGDGIHSETVYQFVNKPFRWWWTLAKPVRGKLIFAILLTTVSMSMITIGATISGWFVDDVYGKGDLSKIGLYCTILVGVPVIRSILGLGSRYLYETSSLNILVRLRAGLYKHLQTMDAPFYDKTSIGELMTRMTGDIDMVRHFSSYILVASLEQFLIFTIGTLYIFSINWILALTALAFSPLIVWIANHFRKEVRPIWDQVRKQFSALNKGVQQNISGNRVVKAFVRADYETEKFEKENIAYHNIILKSVSAWAKYIPALDGLANFLTIPVILVGGILVIKGQMTLGGLVTFNGLLFVISNPMRSVGGLVNEVQRFSSSADKIIEILIQKPDVSSKDHEIHEQPFENSESVVFDHVFFHYSGSKAYPGTSPDWERKTGNQKTDERTCVLKDVSFIAKKGETIGIIGATGSGKSTLVNLIMRFYDATQGRILIDGKNIKEYSLQDLRSHIGIVMQEVFLFSDTVEGNIAYGKISASLQDADRMATIAQANGFIERMTQGYDTIVGERGVGLSGGQRQRIALARALCMNPSILILDDTTSAIDMETEFEIQKGLDEFFSDRTVFVIAHRISSVRKADKILVFDQGQIVESGKHEELIEKKGIYYDVYMTQSGLLYDQKSVEPQREDFADSIDSQNTREVEDHGQK